MIKEKYSKFYTLKMVILLAQGKIRVRRLAVGQPAPASVLVLIRCIKYTSCVLEIPFFFLLTSYMRKSAYETSGRTNFAQRGTSGAMTSRVENDLTSPSVYVLILLLFYWPGSCWRTHISSPSLPSETISHLPPPVTVLASNK